MKRSMLIVAVAASLLTAFFAWALPAEGVTSNAQIRPAGQAPMRLGSEGQLVSANTQGDYYEATRLNEVFAIKTASAGTSFTTAGVSPLAAAGIAWLALYNPPCPSVTSCLNLEIISVTIVGISGTPGVGSQVYDLGCSQTITAAPNATPTGALNPLSPGVGLGYTQTALTGSTVLKEIGIHPYSPFAAAMAATTPSLTATDIVNGRIVVGPGCVFAVQTTAAGTAHIAAGSITYRQAVP